MDRIAEPELMEEEAQARAYAEADFSEPHTWFVELFRERFPDVASSAVSVLDLGCGPADVTTRFALAHPLAEVDGVDGSEVMLVHGRRRVEKAGVAERVSLRRAYLPMDPPQRPQYDVVISNSLLHHLGDPMVLWHTVLVYASPGAPVFVMDLYRPDSRNAARRLVELHGAGEPEVLRRDLFNSLLSAYRVDEIEAGLFRMGLGQLNVETVSDRHVVIWGNR